MSGILKGIFRHAQQMPLSLALIDDTRSMTYTELNAAIAITALELRKHGIASMALLADNGIPWVLGDLAALHAQIPCVPLPHFFSASQMLHAIQNSGVQSILTDRSSDVALVLDEAGIAYRIEGDIQGLCLLRLVDIPARSLPLDTCKITYTSGTTGEPKGVCLGRQHLETVAYALLGATEASNHDKHLCLTPLSTLLENLGGVYVPLMAGAACCVPSLSSVGLGIRGLDAMSMLKALSHFEASTAILAPQMLRGLLAAVSHSNTDLSRLRFLAVGGAPVPANLIEQANKLRLPVFQGYGLSECASVVALNTPTANRAGAVGRLLPHLSVVIADDGEILIDGPVFIGYVDHQQTCRPWPTGDIGFVDQDGYLHIAGRKKDIFITSLGRNVSPEWVEGTLTGHPAILQAAVFGEGKPWNCAVLVVNQYVSDMEIEVAITQVNNTLPDYARIGAWLLVDRPFTPANGLLTPNGRLKRAAIWSVYQDQLESLYEGENAHAVL